MCVCVCIYIYQQHSYRVGYALRVGECCLFISLVDGHWSELGHLVCLVPRVSPQQNPMEIRFV